MHACCLREMVRIKAGRETRIPWSSRCDKIRRPRSSRTSLEQTKNRVRFFFFSLDACENMWIWGARRRTDFPQTRSRRVSCVASTRKEERIRLCGERTGVVHLQNLKGSSNPPLSLSLLSPSFREKRNGRRNYYSGTEKIAPPRVLSSINRSIFYYFLRIVWIITFIKRSRGHIPRPAA